ncbi:hypothetical protein HDF24_04145 [Mucilaginibacter sp. X4EP1]|uniref:hypothetical protein n=1 Tax=Mucilaginibacter sp. X4EP1 TaxID=2723092 RepID=UPI0021671928|nr:hypothetical protein [Mucilaginibacter sp. X4EP1]MCS3816645.1 hypothetical protein [Mucilaginibacter sp. X4EP1]
MKRLITIVGVGIILALFLFFIANPVVTYTIYVLSFIVTISIKKYHQAIQLTSHQAELYSGITTIVTGALFYSMLIMPPSPNDHKGLILTAAVIMGILNVSYALDMSNIISKKKKV